MSMTQVQCLNPLRNKKDGLSKVKLHKERNEARVSRAKYSLIKLESYCDSRGGLISFEKNKNCPFDVKRCFYLFDTKGKNTKRGKHANIRSKFLLIVISGSCRVKIDTGKEKHDFLLNNPYEALYLDKMVWKEMYEFSHNMVLMVLSNEVYDENEYIRSYKAFKRMVSKSSSSFNGTIYDT